MQATKGTTGDAVGIIDEGAVSRRELAELIRSATAWWRLAADELEAGRDERAAGFAYLGRFGLEHAPERLEAIAGPACTCPRGGRAEHCRRCVTPAEGGR